MDVHRVLFLPDGVSASVPAGSTLLEAAAAAGIAIDAPCGRRGVCGKCRVRASGDVAPPTLAERTLIPPEDLEQGWRLGCQTEVVGDVTVMVPERALKAAVVPLSSIPLRPFVRKVHLRLPEPTIQDPISDLGRLRRGLRESVPHLQVDLSAIQRLPATLHSASYDVTAVVAGDRLIALEPGDTTAHCCGLAVDLGTTSVVAVLVDLVTGRILGVESRLNGQANYGADVVSRITYVGSEPDGLATLQSAAVATINSALAALAEKAGVDRHHVYEVVVVGNSCMSHLLLGVDPRSLALAPYQPVVTDPVCCRAAQLGLAINPDGRVYTLPNIAGFVGSDTVAVILATAMHRSDELRLALDLGTNGEMVLGNRDRLLACSTAAGPAFEGARISCGMRATEGAIERVWIENGRVKLQVIGGGPPVGLCGSGLLDAVAQMLRAGVLDNSGRLLPADKQDPSISDGLAERVVRADRGIGFLLSRGDREVVLTQGDVRELQLAKGAIRAGISILLKELGVDQSDLAEILLAGAFGSYISPASARAIGLVPPLPTSKITAVGNAAGQGAVMALLSADLRREATEIARSVQYVELSARADFMDQFMEAMALG